MPDTGAPVALATVAAVALAAAAGVRRATR
jgi:hypothetical protein